MRAPVLVLIVVPLAALACDSPGQTPSASASVQTPSAAPVEVAVSAAAPAGSTSAGPAAPEPCPPGMALVDGRFCIDRWEAATVVKSGELHSPHHAVAHEGVRAVSRPGVLPQAYISMEEADAACRVAGKRLCTAVQWVDACMGTRKPKRTYPYGIKNKPGACNTNQPIHPSSLVHGRRRHDSVSLNDPRLNQQPNTVVETGQFPGCVTPEGVHDLHGNLLEWTRGTEPRPLLMGGHYIDAKIHGNGCTYVTDGHGKQYHDFTTGFRCCAPPLGGPGKEAPEPGTKPPATSAVGARSVGGKIPGPTDFPRDPPGKRSFLDPLGALPQVSPPAYEPEDAACPVDMVHVAGQRCSVPHQSCLEWLPRRSAGKAIACKQFKQPSECRSHGRRLDYCIDTHEFQPADYKYPLVHVSWAEAQNLCEAMDKRLCVEEEWEFACEGELAQPYPYGYERNGAQCNHDYPEPELVTRSGDFIDRRVPARSLPGCKSSTGVFNIVGNVDEWTTRYGARPGKRGILRGGWWLIGRNRCRAATANHGESYAGMQTGFRCCKSSRRADAKLR